MSFSRGVNGSLHHGQTCLLIAAGRSAGTSAPVCVATWQDGGLVSGNTEAPVWPAGDHVGAEAPRSVDQVERPIASFGMPSFRVLPPQRLIRDANGYDYTRKSPLCGDLLVTQWKMNLTIEVVAKSIGCGDLSAFCG